MGFFAVLSTSGAPIFTVPECHINLWSLKGLLGHRLFLCDVGLLLRANKEADLQTIELIFPFATLAETVLDLYPLLRQHDVAQHIFGEPVSLSTTADRTTVTSQIRTFDLWRIDEDNAKLLRSNSDLSHWIIPLRPALPKGTEAYVRVRFDIDELGKTWIWKRSGLGKNGALVDFRVNDVREAAHLGRYQALYDRILPIGALRLFVIAPWSLQSRAVSPPVRYMRVLEGQAWETYLRYAARRRSGRLLVYYWRWPTQTTPALDMPHSAAEEAAKRNDDVDKPLETQHDVKIEGITEHAPFRAFLDLSREFGLMPWGNHVRTLLAIGVGLVILPFIKGGAEYLASLTIPWARLSKWIFGPLSFVVVVTLVGRFRRWAKDTLVRLRRLGRNTERRILWPGPRDHE